MEAIVDELIEQMAAKAPAGPPCPHCGSPTRLVVFGEQWCSRCKVLRPCAEDPRLDALRSTLIASAGAAPAPRPARSAQAA